MKLPKLSCIRVCMLNKKNKDTVRKLFIVYKIKLYLYKKT